MTSKSHYSETKVILKLSNNSIVRFIQIQRRVDKGKNSFAARMKGKSTLQAFQSSGDKEKALQAYKSLKCA